MTSHAHQDTSQKAGQSQGENHGYGYGKTTTSRHARSDTKKKEAYEDYKKLIGWDDLLPWQRDNEYILTSHRRATFSYLRSLKSVLEVHNETVNIWSHILGTAVFFCIVAVLYSSTHRSHAEKGGTIGDDGAIYVYFSSAIACFFFSFIHHIFLDHSEQVRTWTGQFDYLGIVIPLYGTTIASTHFGFRCKPLLQEAYSVFATVAGLACALTTLHPSFSGPRSRHVRTTLYLLLGLSSFLPIIHGVYLFGVEDMNHRMGLGYYLGLGLCHGIGALLYAARIPERWFPKRCDVVGSSHQIMHLLVVCGAATYGVGILGAKRYWQTRGCEVQV